MAATFISTVPTELLIKHNIFEQGIPIAFTATLENAGALNYASKELQKSQETLKKLGVSNLQFFSQQVDCHTIVLATMDMPKGIDADKLWAETQADFKSVFGKINANISDHPRHSDDKSKSPWERAETVCIIRPENATKANSNSTWHSAVTELRKDKEAEYRLLHNNVWPGVIDAIGASNISRFDIFLTEFSDNQPHLFYLFQYTGKDFEIDMDAQATSPVNQRWWKFTDPCQKPLPGAKDRQWLGMVKL